MITILFIILNPKYLYKEGEYFNTEIKEIYPALQFCFLPENPYYDVVYINESNINVDIKYQNLNTKQMSQIQIPKASLNRTFYKELPNIFTDTENNTVYTILCFNEADYYLYELYNPSNSFKVNGKKILRHKIYDSLKDTTIVIKDHKFYKYSFDDNLDDLCAIKKNNDGYKLIFVKSIRDSIIYKSYYKQEEIYYQITDVLSDKYKLDLDPGSIFEIVQFFRRNSYYYNRVFSYTENKGKGLLSARIVGRINANSDNIKEFLIHINGCRWIPETLICYDFKNEKVLWEREFSTGFIQNFKIEDIDNDGKEEILFVADSPCFQFPVDHYRKQYFGKTYKSYFYIFDNRGNIKIINNKPAVIESESGFYKFIYLPILSKNKILAGLYSRFNNKSKQLLLFDLSNNDIVKTDIWYNHLINLYQKDKNFVAINFIDNKIEKILISSNLVLKKIIKRKTHKNIFWFINEKLSIEDKYYSILKPFQILNNKLKVVYIDNDLHIHFPFKVISNKIYFIGKYNNSYFFNEMSFYRNKKINPYILVIFLSELMLISLYFLIRQYITIPIISATNSYFILYKILGKLFLWRLYGKLKQIYVLPKKMSLSKEIPEKILYNISEEPELIYERNFFFLKFKVYEISSTDEFLIIQRISHELKNQVLMLKLMTEEYASDLSSKSQKYISNMSSSLRDISNVAITLSNFSHINKLYLEKVEINNFIESIIAQNINHKYFEKIETEYKNKDIEYKLDKSLFRIAFKNLLDNALDAIDENGYIKIEVFSSKENLYINIKNSCMECPENIQNFHEVGYSTKEQGSGIGIPIAKTIIEKHGGTLEINYEKKEVVVSIVLPILKK
jgi:signal transduction histidine kinase